MKSAALALAGALTLASIPASAATTDFSKGDEGWGGNALVDPDLGNDAPAFHTLLETQAVFWRNESNPAFTGDYTRNQSLTISLDVLTSAISFDGREVTRDLFVMLTDYDADDPAKTATLFYRLGELSSDDAGWQNMAVSIGDTSSSAIPTGWGAMNGNGILGLPAGRDFASVLGSVDAIDFTTFAPQMFYGFAIFDVAGDNFSVRPGIGAVPEPSTWAMMIGGFGVAGGALRRRRTVVKISLA